MKTIASFNAVSIPRGVGSTKVAPHIARVPLVSNRVARGVSGVHSIFNKKLERCERMWFKKSKNRASPFFLDAAVSDRSPIGRAMLTMAVDCVAGKAPWLS